MSTNDEVRSNEPYDVTPIVQSRYFVLPASAAFIGVFIGAVRGSRLASLRFLAENAHRPPKTIRGWYLYNKTKNYRRMAAGLKSGGKDATKLGVTAFVWVGIEDVLERCGPPWVDVKELGAGVGTAGVFSIVYRLPWRTGSRALLLGSLIGGGMGFLRWAREYLRKTVEARGNQDEPEMEVTGGQDLPDDGRSSASPGRK
ncbi:hypothetical protein M405DRAFT_414964 [Rhizopogon salebrosus TDB-379]|nr:hypothetical protein M405DRAFT_414964 [Rhizopogon salebrosus TDB-379]